MKHLHFTGKSGINKNGYITTILYADYGYLLMYKNKKLVEVLILESGNYEQQHEQLSKVVAVRDWRTSNNNNAELIANKKVLEWIKKHKYGMIES